MKAGTTAALPKFYADDAGVLSKDGEDIDVSLKITECFSHTAKTERRLQSPRDFVLKVEQLDVVCKLKSLGTQLRCAEGMSNDVAEDQVRKGITVSKPIRWALLPLQTKASLIACLVGPAAMYGFPAGGYSLSH